MGACHYKFKLNTGWLSEPNIDIKTFFINYRNDNDYEHNFDENYCCEDYVDDIVNCLNEDKTFKQWTKVKKVYSLIDKYNNETPILISPDMLFAVCLARNNQYHDEIYFSVLPLDEYEIITLLNEVCYFENYKTLSAKKFKEFSDYKKLSDVVKELGKDEERLTSSFVYKKFINEFFIDCYNKIQKKLINTLKSHCYLDVYIGSGYTSSKIK